MTKQQIRNALRLLDEGNTPHYIAKYKKELVGDTNPAEIRNLRHTPESHVPDDAAIISLFDDLIKELNEKSSQV